jgi:hypothetical protein
VVNRTGTPVRLDLYSIDAAYYTPLEAAYVSHFSLGKRLLSFGLLGWVFLPLIPLVPFKLFGARAANRRMNAFFNEHGFHGGPVRSGDERSGFVFATLDEGVKSVELELVASDRVHEFRFSIDVPGLALAPVDEGATDPAAGSPEALDETALRSWIESQPRSTTNPRGGVEGDPLNLVVVGDRERVLRCFGARWDEAETITFATSWKTFKAFALDSSYRYSPVSPLYWEGRHQDLALQKARAIINERVHLRLWQTRFTFEGQRVWIGQISRDIGVRFTPKTWNLTTHKIDPDVDEARDYVLDDLMSAGRVSRFGYAAGVEAATASAPRHNLTGDPYFTDGLRAVLVLSDKKARASFFSWA